MKTLVKYRMIISVVFVYLMVMCPLLYAAPVITQVIGSTFSQDTSVLIQGTGLGTNSAVGTDDLQWLGDDIENGTVGQSIGTSIANWSDYYPVSNNEATNSAYDSTSAHSGNKSILQNYYYSPDLSIARYKGYFRWNPGKDLNKVYVSFWVRAEWAKECNAGGAGCQWKIWRLNNSGLNVNSYPDYMQNAWTGGMRETHLYVDSSFGQSLPAEEQYQEANEVAGPSAIENKWVRMEYWFEESDQGVSNGTVQYWLHHPGVEINNPHNLIANQMTRNVPGHFRYAVFGHVSGVPNLKIWWDDFFIQVGTRARVEIGDASTWSACTYREIQVPTLWTDTSITFNFQKGSFADGDTVYLYVVDDGGNVNTTGYPVTIGGEANVPPPSTPLDPPTWVDLPSGATINK